MCIGAHAKTETINWYMDGNTYATTQCETGSDIILPQTPYKYGYTFNGWFGYTPIEYLESTGTQYIDTGVVANETTEAEIEFEEADNILFMVSTGGWNSNNFGIVAKSGAGYIVFYMNCDGYTNYTVKSKISGNIKLLLDGIYFNNERLGITSGNIPALTKFSTTHTIPLFARKWNNNISEKFAYKLKYLKIWQDYVLVRDFIPVLDSNGIPCMFDKVEKKFYYNAGTGQFIAGPVIGE